MATTNQLYVTVCDLLEDVLHQVDKAENDGFSKEKIREIDETLRQTATMICTSPEVAAKEDNDCCPLYKDMDGVCDVFRKLTTVKGDSEDSVQKRKFLKEKFRNAVYLVVKKVTRLNQSTFMAKIVDFLGKLLGAINNR